MLSNFAKKYALIYSIDSDNEIRLLGDKYIIRFVLDREGISTTYVDLDSSLLYDIELFMVLTRKAHLAPASPEQGEPQDAFECKRVIDLIEQAGRDILNGGQDWRKEYEWPPLHVSGLIKERH